MAKHSNGTSFLLIASVAAGALFLSTDKGAQTKRYLKQSTRSLKHTLSKHVNLLKYDVKTAYHQAKSDVAHNEFQIEQKKAELLKTVKDIKQTLLTQHTVPDDKDILKSALEDARLSNRQTHI